MTREEVKEVIRILKDAYRDKFDMSQSSFNVWCENMSDLRVDVAKKAASEYIRRSQFPPTIADIRNEYKVLWDSYLAMVRHINESFDSAAGYYPNVTEQQWETAHITFLKTVGAMPRDRRERAAQEISQRIIAYVKEREAGAEETIITFDECVRKITNEFGG